MIDKINFLKKYGYVILGNKFLSENEIEILATSLRKIFYEMKEQNAKDFTSAAGGFEGIKYITQYNEDIHNILDKLFSSKVMLDFLTEIMGKDYKIWTINYRIASSKDRGLSFHQDSDGETNLTIFLKDNLSGSGTTSFIPGSHLLNFSLRKYKIGIPLFFNKLLTPFATILRGEKGQVSLFFNKVWHGRIKNKTEDNYDAILISLFPNGSSFGSKESGNWDPSYLSKFKNSSLIKLIDPNLNTKRIDEYRVTIKNNQSNSFAQDLYANKIKIISFDYYKSYLLFYFFFLFSKIRNLIKN